MGILDYYSAASHITLDLNKLSSRLNKALFNRLNEMRKEATLQDLTKTLQKRYKGYECKLYKIKGMVIVPIHAQRCKVNLNFSQSICTYTTVGRNKIHQSLRVINKQVLAYVMKEYITSRSIEYNDNRISRFIAQYGNLMIVHAPVHRLIHMKNQEKIQVLLNVLKLNEKQLKKVNELRELCLNEAI